MGDLGAKNFGLLIAFILPGFLLLLGISEVSPAARVWLDVPASCAPTIGGFFYAALASLLLGVTISGVRWLLLDPLFHLSGLTPPEWDFSRLQQKLPEFLALVDAHYRFFQFYSNLAVALPAAFALKMASGTAGGSTLPLWALLLALECVLLAAARDCLKKYYRRGSDLLDRCPGLILPAGKSH